MSGRRGSAYVVVVGMMTLLALIGLSAVGVSGAGLRSAVDTADSTRAASAALSAIEVGLDELRSIDRPTAFGGVPTRLQGIHAEFGYRVEDPYDGDLGGDPSDPAEILGVGESGRARWAETAIAVDDPGLPIEPLGSALHARDRLEITIGATLTASGAAVSTDGELSLGGTIDGDAGAASRSGAGTVTGTLTVPTPERGIARREVFDEWAARGTELGFSGPMFGEVLSPAVNTYNGTPPDPHGVYVIRTGGSDLEIRSSRILGTLVVDADPGGTVTIRDAMVLEPARVDAPALLIRGEAVLGVGSGSLAELVRSMNPPGAPHEGIEDLDLDDTFPSGVRGLVYVFGGLTLEGDGRYVGSILVDGGVTVLDRPEIEHDRMMILAPPLGFGDNLVVGDMRLRPLSHERVPLP